MATMATQWESGPVCCEEVKRVRQRAARGVLSAFVVVCAVVLLLLVPATVEASVWTDVDEVLLASYGLEEHELEAVSEGYEDGTWRPYEPVTRAQLAKMAVLAFAPGTDAPGGDAAEDGTAETGAEGAAAVPERPRLFDDVAANSPFYDYIYRACDLGIMRGLTVTTFGPDLPASRQQVAAVIVRYVSAANGIFIDNYYHDLARAKEILAPYYDAYQIDDALLRESAYAVHRGILRGTGNGLDPRGAASRIACAALLVRGESAVAGNSVAGSMGSAVVKGILMELGSKGADKFLSLLFGGGPDPTKEILDKLAEISGKLDGIIADLATILDDLAALSKQLEYDMTKVQQYIAGMAAQGAVTTIKTHYDQAGWNSLAGFFNKKPADVPAEKIKTFAANVQGSWDIEKQVTTIHDVICPDVGIDGLLDLWTKEFILKTVTADNLNQCYLSLENYFATLLLYQMKGATLVCQAMNYDDPVVPAGGEAAAAPGDAAAAPAAAAPAPAAAPGSSTTEHLDTVQDMIDEEVARFRACVKQLLIAAIRPGANLTGSQDFLPAGAADTMARSEFFSVQSSGDETFGLRGLVVVTDEVTVTSAAATDAAGASHGGAIASTDLYGPTYDSWTSPNTMTTSTLYRAIDVDFGALGPGGYNVAWLTGDPRGQMDAAVATYTEDYEKSPEGTIQYGYFLGQTRHGGSQKFVTALWQPGDKSVQVENRYSSAGSATVEQDPANLVVQATAIPGGEQAYPVPHFWLPDIHVTLQVKGPAFTFAGPAATAAQLGYVIDVAGGISVRSFFLPGTSDKDSRNYYRYGLLDVTDGTAAYNSAGVSSQVTTTFGAKDTTGSVAVTLQPGHTYQPYAEWLVDVDGMYRAGMGFTYTIATNSTLDCRGAAVGF